MGLIRANMLPLLREMRRHAFHGSVLCLGYPDAYFTKAQLFQMAKSCGAVLDASQDCLPAAKIQHAAKGYISGISALKMLGFQNVEILDYSSYEGNVIKFDLNSTSLPGDYRGHWDMVLDHGTLEHVFNVPTALSHIHAVLKVGGYVYHFSPASNAIDHGFYCFSPTLFYDYYTANRWRIELLQVYQGSAAPEFSPCWYADYDTGLFDCVSMGGLSNAFYGVACLAVKTRESSCNIAPQQHLFQNRWERVHPRDHMLRAWNSIAARHGRIAVYGAGKFTHRLMSDLKALTLPMPALIWDDRPSCSEECGVPIASLPASLPEEIQAIVLGTDTFQDKMRERLKSMFPKLPPIYSLT